MTDGQVCCGCVVVHPDVDVELNIADADWRCWRQGYSCQQGSVALCCLDTGGLSGRAWTWHDLPHRASASRHVEAVTVHGRTCMYRWQGTLLQSWLVAVCPSQTFVHWQTPCGTRVVTKAWAIVFMVSSSNDHRTRQSRRSQKNNCAQTVETCLSRLRSHEKVTPSTRAWCDAMIASESAGISQHTLYTSSRHYTHGTQRANTTDTNIHK